MKKMITLTDEITNEDGHVIAKMNVLLKGDGETPNIMTVGGMPVGYNDDGTPIIPKYDKELIDQAHQEMMKEAIKEQKALCVENGVDPELVNILNAEKKNDDSEEITNE